jgi:hypothetical protein
MEVVMRPPEVFVRSLLHQEAVKLKRMSTRAEHQSTRIRAAILPSNVKTPVPQMARMWLTDESHVRKVIHELNDEGFVVCWPTPDSQARHPLHLRRGRSPRPALRPNATPPRGHRRARLHADDPALLPQPPEDLLDPGQTERELDPRHPPYAANNKIELVPTPRPTPVI